MTVEQAMEIATNALQGDGTNVSKEKDEACCIMQNAMQKQIPKTVEQSGYCFLCPNCHNAVKIPFIYYSTIDYHCFICGQALDWSELSEKNRNH